MHRPLSWHDAFSVGHEGLDDEHFQLIGLINKFCAAIEEKRDRRESLAVLRTLRSVTEAHLWHEDAVLREIQSSVNSAAVEPQPRLYLRAVADAAIEAHLASHKEVRDSLIAVTRDFHSASELDQSALCADLMAWFVDHAVKHDTYIRAVFQAVSAKEKIFQ